jgi:hypothetical protein
MDWERFMNNSWRQEIDAEPLPLTLRYEATDEDLPAELFDGPARSTVDIKGLTDLEQTTNVSMEVLVAKKKTGRPMKGEELMEYRVSTVLTKEEKERLDQIAETKRWSMATLIRELIETRYPEVFEKGKGKS